jgi:hypothetical protein
VPEQHLHCFCIILSRRDVQDCCAIVVVVLPDVDVESVRVGVEEGLSLGEIALFYEREECVDMSLVGVGGEEGVFVLDICEQEHEQRIGMGMLISMSASNGII